MKGNIKLVTEIVLFPLAINIIGVVAQCLI